MVLAIGDISRTAGRHATRTNPRRTTLSSISTTSCTNQSKLDQRTLPSRRRTCHNIDQSSSITLQLISFLSKTRAKPRSGIEMKRAIRALPVHRPISSGRIVSMSRWQTDKTLMRHPRTHVQQRQFHLHPLAAAPLLLTGLFVALWTWKCTMLVLFQNAIIYNPFMPPNARSMRIEEFARQCGGVQWREQRIRSLDGTEIALCVSQHPQDATIGASSAREVYILYFQGK